MLHQLYGKLKSFMKNLKPGNRRTRNQSAAIVSDDPTARPWFDLPPELLSLIANRLSIIQLFAFRGVCKTWRSASSTASAERESKENTKLSLMVFDHRDKKCSLYYRTEMEAADHHGGRIYGLNIPELENANCLASNQGWLLLHQKGSLFFFCPFSRSRIDLPKLPESELSDHIAAFSAPPTSHQCIVSVVKRCNRLNIKLHVLRRGNGAWTTYEKDVAQILLGTISAALYVEQNSSFYFMGDDKKMLRFSVENIKWTCYQIVNGSDNESREILPFNFREDHFNRCKMKTSMGLGDDVSISICGTPLTTGQRTVTYVCDEKVEASGGSANSELKGIWIQPRFLQIPENQRW